MGDASVLDWMSGLVVPVMLGVFTLGVAVWAAMLARQSNRLSRDALEAAARDRRAPYAAAVWHRVGAMLAARQTGRNPLEDHLSTDLEKLQAVDALRIQAIDPSARTLTLWASLTARKAEITSLDDILDLNQRLSEMIERWVFDPAGVRDEIEADEWFVKLRDGEEAAA